jgi:superfamily I DNA/RNA helicase
MVVLDLLARNRRVAVSGGAGTGKTCLALAKAESLAREGFRTLLTCFSRPLAQHLARCAGGTPGLTVVNFHQFCFDLALAGGVPLLNPAGATPPPEYFEQQMPAALDTALARRPDLRFDAVVVDEAQDFAGAWWPPLLRALDDPDHGILYIFHDDNQRLYRPETAFPAGLVPITLTRNLRNTQAICRIARRFYSGGKFIPAGPEGQPVEFIEAEPGPPTEEALNRVLHRLLDEEKVPAGDLAVLSGHRRERSPVGQDGLLGDFACTETPELEPDRVLFQTIHRFKGLERPVIILMEMEDRVDNEEILYVGVSRARAHLIVIGTGGTLSLLRAAAGAPGG